MVAFFFARSLRFVTLGIVAMTGLACSGLLDVSNPTLVRDSDITNASGANARRVTVMLYQNQIIAPVAEDVARITDEWAFDGPNYGFPGDALDGRDSELFEQNAGTFDQHLGFLDRLIWESSIAIQAVRAYTPDSLRGDFLGQLYGVRGWAIAQMAEDMCPGFPINDVTANNEPIFSGPFTTDSAFTFASAQLDSAIKYVHDSTRFIALARVAKGRVLLDQGKYAEAAAVVAPVATAWVYRTDGAGNSIANDWGIGNWDQGGKNFAVGDGEGENGLPFASARDPRVPLLLGGTAADDPTDTLYKSTKYSDLTSPFVLAGGIEARLIEAEVALHNNDATWLTILNTLRATAITPAMPPLVDPGSAAARIDVLYSERAFWMYLTGRRLGDLRRLIKNYGRNAETVFPTGDYPTGGTYGTATSIPFILAGQKLSNPHITEGCTTR